MKFLSDDIKVAIFEETRNQDLEVSDYFTGIYEVISHGFFDVTFIPKFKRENDLWYLSAPNDFDEINSNEEARLITASVGRHIVTPDAFIAGTKQKFFTPPLYKAEEEYFDSSPDKQEYQSIYYVTSNEFYTFRGELATIVAERETGLRHLINIKELLEFSFIQFILYNVITDKKLEQLKKKAGINLIEV